MPDVDDRLEAQLRAWADDLAGQVEPQVPVLPRRPWWPRVAAVAAGVAALAATAVVGRGGGGEEVAVGSSHLVPVEHEVLTYVQEAELDCPGAPLSTESGGRAVIEVWGDRGGRRWRNEVRYPGGGERQLVVRGDPWYPESGGRLGHPVLPRLGCEDDGIGVLVAEPAATTFVALNPMAEPLRLPGGAPAVQSFRQLAEVVAGDHRDSLGRPARRWRQVVTGDIEGRPVVQTTEWFVDPERDQVLEQTYENRLEGVGVARWRLTATELGELEVPASTFSTVGYTRIEASPPPWEGGVPTTTTLLVGGDEGVHESEMDQANRFIAMARSLDAGTVDAVGFAATVRLAVGGEVVSAVPREELAQEAAWVVDLGSYAARAGEASALALIRSRQIDDLTTSPGPGGGCQSPPGAPDVESSHVLVIEPGSVDSCVQWFAVDLYVDDGDVVLVDIRLYEP